MFACFIDTDFSGSRRMRQQLGYRLNKKKYIYKKSLDKNSIFIPVQSIPPKAAN
jgi:hypothetical protein